MTDRQKKEAFAAMRMNFGAGCPVDELDAREWGIGLDEMRGLLDEFQKSELKAGTRWTVREGTREIGKGKGKKTLLCWRASFDWSYKGGER